MIDLTRLGVFLRGRGSLRSPTLAASFTIGATSTGAAVAWPTPSSSQASHLLCLAASGAGKTLLIAQGLLQELLAADSDEAALVIDPKGDLIEMLLRGLCALAPERLAAVS